MMFTQTGKDRKINLVVPFVNHQFKPRGKNVCLAHAGAQNNEAGKIIVASS